MKLARHISLFILLFLAYFTCLSQNTIEYIPVAKDGIKSIRKVNKSKQTYHFQRLQYVRVSSSIWDKSKEEKKQFIKKIFPKLYNFINKHSLFEATLLLDSYKKGNKTKEFLINSNSNGLKRPKLLSLALQSDMSDFRSKVIKITGGRYYNPIYFPNKYNFKYKEINGENKQLFIYEFFPKKKNKYLLDGYFHTDSKGNINYFKALPSKHNKNVDSDILFENDTLKGKSIPQYSKTETKLISKNRKVNGLEFVSETHHLNTEISKKRIGTSNISLDLDAKESSHPIFDSIQFKNQSDSFEFAMDVNTSLEYLEALRYGRMGFGKIDMLLKHLISYNNVEGVRFGLGLATNHKWNERYDIGGYFAGGTRDLKMKFGGFTNLYIHKRTNSQLSINYVNDLLEPGKVIFPFSKRLFISEGFRKYAITKMDRVSRFESKIKTTIWKNIFVEAGFSNKHHSPLYDYIYSDNFKTFNSNEVSIGIRYNAKEKFFKMNNRLYSLGSKYPSLYINYSKSVELEGYKYYDYNRIDAKIEKNIHLMEYGIIDFQLIGGYINTDNLPYSLSYNLQGSYKAGTPLIHNTFGTMGYNEFVATKYLALFYLHNLGKIAHQKTFQPEFLLIHNMGVGNSIDLDIHQDIIINSMNRGYFESGFYLKNLISLQNIIGQTGFGAGFMYRYGAYQYAQNLDNLVFKFSLDIDI